MWRQPFEDIDYEEQASKAYDEASTKVVDDAESKIDDEEYNNQAFMLQKAYYKERCDMPEACKKLGIEVAKGWEYLQHAAWTNKK